MKDLSIVKKATQLKESLRGVTDVEGDLSYSNGVKNILGIKKTNEKIRLRVSNPSDDDRVLIIAPAASAFLGDGVTTVAALLGLTAETSHVFTPATYDDGADPAVTTFKVENLNSKQKLESIAIQAANSPMFIRAANLKSYKTTDGTPESSNFGNEIAHYGYDYFKGLSTKSTPIILSDFEKRTDTTTNTMKVDFIDMKFPAFVSSKDFVVIQINAKTKMDIDLFIGSRVDAQENFFKKVSNGVEVLHSQFPESVNSDNCGC